MVKNVSRIIGALNASGTPLTGVQLPVTMRTTPSVTSYGAGVAGASFNVYADTDVASACTVGQVLASPNNVRFNFTGHSQTSKVFWCDTGKGSPRFSFTCDAEL